MGFAWWQLTKRRSCPGSWVTDRHLQRYLTGFTVLRESMSRFWPHCYAQHLEVDRVLVGACRGAGFAYLVGVAARTLLACIVGITTVRLTTHGRAATDCSSISYDCFSLAAI